MTMELSTRTIVGPVGNLGIWELVTEPNTPHVIPMAAAITTIGASR